MTRTRLQTRRANVPDHVAAVIRRPATELEPNVRHAVESRMRFDFSQVRVHADAHASASADRLDANAYTFGHHVVFGRDQYAPSTVLGRQLIAHELAHVMQQQTSGAPAIQCQGRGKRGAEDNRDERRAKDTEAEFKEDQGRGRKPGGRQRDRDGRRRDLYSDFDSDWAGRAILSRYLSGEGDWHIKDDANWTDYMKRSVLLRDQLKPQVIDEAKRVSGAASTEAGPLPIAKSFHAELENGEGIIGYQYLHGTNKDVGDFEIKGSATAGRIGNESSEDAKQSVQPGATVQMNVQFVWNDKIDPNPEYGSDTIKSTIAEIITLGEAEPYIISIAWSGQPSVWIPEGGRPKVFGYPGK